MSDSVNKKYKVVKFVGTYPDGQWKDLTIDEAKELLDQKEKYNYPDSGTKYYIREQR